MATYKGSNDIKLFNIYSPVEAVALMNTNEHMASQNKERDELIENTINSAIQEGCKNGYKCNYIDFNSIVKDSNNEMTIEGIRNLGVSYYENFKTVLRELYDIALVYDWEYNIKDNGVPENIKRITIGFMVFWDYVDDTGEYQKLYPINTVIENNMTKYEAGTFSVGQWYNQLVVDLCSYEYTNENKTNFRGAMSDLVREISAPTTSDDVKKEKFEQFQEYHELLKLLNKERLGVYPDVITATV